MKRDEWVRAKLRELSKRPAPKPTREDVERAARHASGHFRIEKKRS